MPQPADTVETIGSLKFQVEKMGRARRWKHVDIDLVIFILEVPEGFPITVEATSDVGQRAAQLLTPDVPVSKGRALRVFAKDETDRDAIIQAIADKKVRLIRS